MNAQDAVGVQEPNDWILSPQEHADRLPKEAGPLKRILKSDAIKPIMETYDEADSKAQTHQNSYKKWGQREIYLTAAAAVIGSILLYISNNAASSTQFVSVLPLLRKILVFLQALSLAGVAAATYMQRSGGFFKKWMLERTKAEEARFELFETVCGLRGVTLPISVQDNEIPLLPLQLEYFRRYQLEVQINFYKGRGKQHENAAARLLSRGAIIIFLGALAAAITSSVAEFGNWINAFAIMGVITPVLIGAQGKLSLLNQDERNAIRYGITLGHLRECQKQLEAARQAAEKNELGGVHSLITKVHEIISVENKEWKEQTGPVDSSKASRGERGT